MDSIDAKEKNQSIIVWSALYEKRDVLVDSLCV